MFYLQAEDRGKRLALANTELQSQITMSGDEMADIMKKYKALVQQVFNVFHTKPFIFKALVKNLV
jgi:Mor family transcriptional regulator